MADIRDVIKELRRIADVNERIEKALEKQVLCIIPQIIATVVNGEDVSDGED